MSDLSRLADFAEIFGVLVVVGGVVFAVLQMRQIRQQRREMAAIELFRFFGSPQFNRAYRRVLALPDGLDKQQLLEHDENIEDCAMVISTTMENIGVMVYHRIVPSIVVSHLVGNSTVILWRKLRLWVADSRAELDNEGAFEWFEWLALILDEMNAADGEPAYVAHRDWKPSRDSRQIGA